MCDRRILENILKELIKYQTYGKININLAKPRLSLDICLNIIIDIFYTINGKEQCVLIYRTTRLSRAKIYHAAINVHSYRRGVKSFHIARGMYTSALSRPSSRQSNKLSTGK